MELVLQKKFGDNPRNPENGEILNTERKRRVTIKKARRFLGAKAKKYSDDELKRVIDMFYGIAGVAFRSSNFN